MDDLLEADFGTTSESALKHDFWIARQPGTIRSHQAHCARGRNRCYSGVAADEQP